jgi:hypothetical protein
MGGPGDSPMGLSLEKPINIQFPSSIDFAMKIKGSLGSMVTSP